MGIRNELFSLIFKLNEKVRIEVNSPHGMSGWFGRDRIVKQGSVLGSNLCSSSTGELCDRNFSGGSNVGIVYINDLLYVDDTTDINTNINEVIASHQQVVNFAKSKRLLLNSTKCCMVIINKRTKDSIPTLYIGDGEMK